MESLPPPPYTSPCLNTLTGAPVTGAAAPAYTPPSSYWVGVANTRLPFVHVPQIKDHLALLHAFSELKIQVEGLPDADIPLLPSDKERRWACFVGFAVERFEKWCKNLQPGPSQSEKGIATILPPIDVLMVWHAYLLNPMWYAEDVDRVELLEGLKITGEALASSLGKTLGQLIASEPSKSRVDKWVQLTATPFNPLESAKETVHKEIACPKCRAITFAPYITKEGTGYLQQFRMACVRSGCNFEITRNGLALRKFASDLSKSRMISPSDFLAGTLRTPTKAQDLDRGRIIKKDILSSTQLLRPLGEEPEAVTSDQAYADFLMAQAKYELNGLQDVTASKMRAPGRKIIRRIISAYVDDKIFSVELVGAVLRQGSFVNKMDELQWTRSGFFESAEDEAALHHAIARYHAFLDLLGPSAGSLFVPTLDIDLVWHTHQLMAANYSKDTVQYVQRFIDHDDKVEESRFASAFDMTCRAWKNLYDMPYTHCGCPLPGDTIGQKLSRLFGLTGIRRSSLLPPDRADLRAATHPSDHNAVFTFKHKAEAAAAQRGCRSKIEKRAQQDVERGNDNGTHDSQRHDPAFCFPCRCTIILRQDARQQM
ncbi:hypothetical protein C8J57DRAFT_1176997 [Mycena rebaudengoi]|nr:hypothetical protein C8J57DRAFT_1176997 [Mycena rebaudengoi]